MNDVEDDEYFIFGGGQLVVERREGSDEQTKWAEYENV
jgi:hypothetical protein